MIRPIANFQEIQAVIDLMEEAFCTSRWALTPGAAVDRDEAKKLLINAKDRATLRRDGATYFRVAESNGKLTGFMIGEINRIYGVGTLLQASDLYLYSKQAGADPMDWMRMVKGYLDWARSIPRVAQIVIQQYNFIEGEHEAAIQRYYRHLEFKQVGAIFEQRAA